MSTIEVRLVKCVKPVFMGFIFLGMRIISYIAEGKTTLHACNSINVTARGFDIMSG